MEKAREFHKSIYFCFIDYAKAFDCVDHSKLWKILKEMGIPTTSWWRDLKECGPLERGKANHFSILALRTP